MFSATTAYTGKDSYKGPLSWKSFTGKIMLYSSDFIEKPFNIWRQPALWHIDRSIIIEPLIRTTRYMAA